MYWVTNHDSKVEGGGRVRVAVAMGITEKKVVHRLMRVGSGSYNTKRQNELYSEVCKLFYQSSTHVVPALLPCCQGKLGELTKTAYKIYRTVHSVSW